MRFGQTKEKWSSIRGCLMGWLFTERGSDTADGVHIYNVIYIGWSKHGKCTFKCGNTKNDSKSQT